MYKEEGATMKFLMEFLCLVLICPVLIPTVALWAMLEFTTSIFKLLSAFFKELTSSISDLLYGMRDFWNKRFPW